MRDEQVLARPNLDPDIPATEAQEQTGSQPSEDSVIEFKPTAKYQDPNDPDKVIEGNILKTRVNLGSLASKFQSERDTALTRAQQLAQQIAEANQQIATLQKQIAAREQEETTLATIRRLGIKPESQDTENGGSSWFTEDEQQPQVTQQQILQELNNIEQRVSKQAQDEVGRIIERYTQENMENQQSSQRVQSFVSRARQADEAQLRADMPDVPEAEIKQILNFHEASRALEMKAQDAIREGDEAMAEEAYLQAQARASEARNLQAQALNRQKELAAEKELQQQTEMYAPGGQAFQELEEKRPKRLIINKAKSKAAQEEHLEAAKQFEANRRRIFSR